MPTSEAFTRSKVYIAGRLLDVIVKYKDVRETILAENTFLNHLGADLEVTGMRARILTLQGVILSGNDRDMTALEEVLEAQQQDAVELSIPGFGVFEGFAESVHIDRSGELEGYDFDLSFKEHTPVERPDVTAVNVAQATAAAADTGVTKTHHIVKGDTLWFISLRYLNDPRLWRKIADLNPGIDPRRLRVGSTIRIT